MARLAVIGLGYIGASLGLALRPANMFAEIAGYDGDRDRLQAARHGGAIDSAAQTIAGAVEGAAVVVVTVPAHQLEDALLQVGPALEQGAVLTETTRWKLPAQRLAAALLPSGTRFVAGRPVVDGGDADEPSASGFRNALYCLAPASDADETAIAAISAVATATGAQPFFLDAAEHDALTAAGELLPGAALAALATVMTADPSWRDAGRLAGDAFNRLALLAEGLPASFWQEAFANSDALDRWLAATADKLLELRARLAANDQEQLAADWQVTLAALASWRRERRQLQERTMPARAELKPNILGALGRRPAGR